MKCSGCRIRISTRSNFKREMGGRTWCENCWAKRHAEKQAAKTEKREKRAQQAEAWREQRQAQARPSAPITQYVCRTCLRAFPEAAQRDSHEQAHMTQQVAAPPSDSNGSKEFSNGSLLLGILIFVAAFAAVVWLVTGQGDSPSSDEAAAEVTPAETTTPTSRVSVPDWTGMPLNRARSGARGLDLKSVAVDCSGRDRMVLRASNWVVVSHQPAPLSSARTGDEVLFCVVKYDD